MPAARAGPGLSWPELCELSFSPAASRPQGPHGRICILKMSSDSHQGRVSRGSQPGLLLSPTPSSPMLPASSGPPGVVPNKWGPLMNTRGDLSRPVTLPSMRVGVWGGRDPCRAGQGPRGDAVTLHGRHPAVPGQTERLALRSRQSLPVRPLHLGLGSLTARVLAFRVLLGLVSPRWGGAWFQADQQPPSSEGSGPRKTGQEQARGSRTKPLNTKATQHPFQALMVTRGCARRDSVGAARPPIATSGRCRRQPAHRGRRALAHGEGQAWGARATFWVEMVAKFSATEAFSVDLCLESSGAPYPRQRVISDL
ncbi:hypothetical protein HJG60_009186 [Phyllostomus discolor]|uniref:Uncharacterized protein n=1 Tax=Phyllostomus discolor TaxID=89673 RepID=A0A833YQN4_9CHIR|nr:hypothetical protein HJG60_009186 [Phyllostomus discolor]